MYIDENLRWDHHIDTLVKNISFKISILRSLRNVVPIDTLKLMYNAIVLIHFDYADVVYDAASETNKYRLGGGDGVLMRGFRSSEALG